MLFYVMSAAEPFRFDYENERPGIRLCMAYLGLTVDMSGVCYGIAFMAIQAAKRGDLDTFLKRMDIIECFESQDDLNAALDDALAKRKAKKLLTPDEKLLCSIPAFLEGVSLYHSSMKWKIDYDLSLSDLARREAAMSLQTIYNTLKITEQDYQQADAFFNEIPMESIKQFTSEQSDFLAVDLESRFDDLASTIGDFSLSISNFGHRIAIIRSGSEWVLVDHDNLTRSGDLDWIKSKTAAALKLSNTKLTRLEFTYHMGNEADITEILRTKPVDHGELMIQVDDILPLYRVDILKYMKRHDIDALDDELESLSNFMPEATKDLSEAELTCYQHALADCFALYKDDGVSLLHDKIKAGNAELVTAYFNGLKRFASEGLLSYRALATLLFASNDNGSPAAFYAIFTNKYEMANLYFKLVHDFFKGGYITKDDALGLITADDLDGRSLLYQAFTSRREDQIQGYLMTLDNLVAQKVISSFDVANMYLQPGLFSKILYYGQIKHVETYLQAIATVATETELSSSAIKDLFLNRDEDDYKAILGAANAGRMDMVRLYHKAARNLVNKGLLTPKDYQKIILTRKQYKYCEAEVRKVAYWMPKSPRLCVPTFIRENMGELESKSEIEIKP